MKKLIHFTIILAAIFLSSCAEDQKDDPISPSTDSRDKYAAYWDVIENSSVAGQNSFIVNITKSTSNSGEIILNNFSDLSVSARASVNNNILTIPYQQIGAIGFTQGSGTLTNATSISLNYTNTIGSNPPENCTAVYTKQ